jgi:hypothetical protein
MTPLIMNSMLFSGSSNGAFRRSHDQLGLVVIWGVVLVVNRTPPLHLNACEALKYYLGALDEASTKLPVQTRQLLDTQAAACLDEDLGSFDDGNPHQ